MKMRIASLTILWITLAAVPAVAQVLYDDGPINGTTDAWTINYGFVIGDSFTLLNNSTVGGFNFGVWEFQGDVLTSVVGPSPNTRLAGPCMAPVRPAART
jgi:hypothetical protein